MARRENLGKKMDRGGKHLTRDESEKMEWETYYGSRHDKDKPLEQVRVGGSCATCGRKLKDEQLTHCSEECLFDEIKNSEQFIP